jgi:hypothetical protein
VPLHPSPCRNVVKFIALCKLTAQLPGLKGNQKGRWALVEEFLKVSPSAPGRRKCTDTSQHQQPAAAPAASSSSSSSRLAVLPAVRLRRTLVICGLPTP